MFVESSASLDDQIIGYTQKVGVWLNGRSTYHQNELQDPSSPFY